MELILDVRSSKQNRHRRKRGLWVASILAVVGICAHLPSAQAINPDTMVVSVTPMVTYAVSITSPSAGGYNFGLVALNTTTGSTSAITVQNTGDVSEFFSLAVTNSSGGWVPGATRAADQFVLSGYFNGPAGTQPPDYSVVTSTIATTAPSVSGNRWNQSGARTLSGSSQHLWLKLDMPITSSVTGAQTMVLSVNGQAN